MSYTPEERETIIRMDDSEPEIMHIYTAQRKMITKLLRNPLFTATKTETEQNGRVIGLTGTLISKCLTIRTKQVKNANNGESLKKWRESQGDNQ